MMVEQEVPVQVRDIHWLDTIDEARKQAADEDRLVLVMGLLNGMGCDDMW